MIYRCTRNTLIGNLTITEEEGFITEINNTDIIYNDKSKLIDKTFVQLDEYFNKKRKNFDIPIKLHGTDFQMKVWNELKNIPYGTTKTYKEIAANIGKPNASRVVGNANNKNKLLILIPCHRVIGTNGSLVGFAVGLDIKNKLLQIEK